MQRLKLALIGSGLLFATQAFAADPAPTEASAEVPPEANTEAAAGMEGTVTATASPTSTVPESAIERRYVAEKGKVHAYGAIDATTTSVPNTMTGMTSSSTGEGLGIGAGYGVTDKITAGAQYGFALNEFEIKGPLALYGEYELVHDGKMSITASADLTFNFAADTAVALNAGLGARYLLAPKMALFTGAPYGPGPVGQHLTIGLNNDAPTTFDIPLGFAYQAMPKLFTYVDTNLATFVLVNKPMNTDSAFLIGDAFVPFRLGGLYALNKDIDVTAAFGADLKAFGDSWGLSVGARWHN